MFLELVRSGVRLLGPGPTRDEALGSRIGKKVAPAFPALRGEEEEENGVSAQGLKAFPHPVPLCIRELGSMLYQQASCGPFLFT